MERVTTDQQGAVDPRPVSAGDHVRDFREIGYGGGTDGKGCDVHNAAGRGYGSGDSSSDGFDYGCGYGNGFQHGFCSNRSDVVSGSGYPDASGEGSGEIEGAENVHGVGYGGDDVGRGTRNGSVRAEPATPLA